MSYTVLKVLLDSTYLLPSFGIEVEKLSDKDILRLREAAVEGKVKFYCLSVAWIEVIGKIYREGRRLNIDLGEILDVALKSLLESGFYKWIQPTSEAIKLAFKLRTLGHRDNIDNLLYAMSIVNKMIFLTMDRGLISFLSEHDYGTENLMNHKQLFSKIW